MRTEAAGSALPAGAGSATRSAGVGAGLGVTGLVSRHPQVRGVAAHVTVGRGPGRKGRKWAANRRPPAPVARTYVSRAAAGAEVAAAGPAPALRALPWRPPARPGPFVVVQLQEQLIGFPAPPRAAPAPGRPIGCAGASGAALREVVTNARDLAPRRRPARGRNKPGQQSGSPRAVRASGGGERAAAGDWPRWEPAGPRGQEPDPGAASAE